MSHFVLHASVCVSVCLLAGGDVFMCSVELSEQNLWAHERITNNVNASFYGSDLKSNLSYNVLMLILLLVGLCFLSKAAKLNQQQDISLDFLFGSINNTY